MVTILLVTNDERQASAVRRALAGRSYRLVAVSPEEAPSYAGPEVDLILMDFPAQAPLAEHMESLHTVRKGKPIPILVLLSEDQLGQFRNGVSDFVVKPYVEAELLVRLERLLGALDHGKDQLVRCGDLLIDPVSYDVTLAGETLDLTFTEYKLLEFMASRPGRVLTREAILDVVWGADCFVGDRTVDVHIRRLRSKIEEGGRSFIETVRNVGYRFKRAG